MADPNRDDFLRRIDRVQSMYRQGGGFEAAGAVGRSHYTRKSRARVSVLGPIAVVLAVFLGLKGVIHAQIGAGAYDQRVNDLALGTPLEQAGAYVLQADTVTLWISGQVAGLFPAL